MQEFKKISIVEAKGYCYGWHFYLSGDADLVVASADALFGHPAFRYVGWGPRLWTWVETIGLRKFQEMLFTGRSFSAKEMYECGFVNSVVPREKLEEETLKYATACARSRPVDTGKECAGESSILFRPAGEIIRKVENVLAQFKAVGDHGRAPRHCSDFTRIVSVFNLDKMVFTSVEPYVDSGSKHGDRRMVERSKRW